MSTQDQPGDETVVIKKYANRRLYNTSSSTYVTLEDLSAMVKQGVDFQVFDAKTGEDITRSVLTQIIFEEEGKGQNLLPTKFLRQLIRFYGDSMQVFVPSYLEFSLESLSREQDKFREQMMKLSGTPFQAMEEQAKQNMAMFQQAMQMFNPFAGPAPGTEAKPEAAVASAPDSEKASSASEDIDALRRQMDQLQRQLQAIAESKK